LVKSGEVRSSTHIVDLKFMQGTGRGCWLELKLEIDKREVQPIRRNKFKGEK
jgi:hypothetical protein